MKAITLLIMAAACFWLSACVRPRPATARQRPPLPPVQRPARTAPVEIVVYASATATDKFGLESDYSNEAGLTGAVSTVTYAWDKPAGTNVITNYTLYYGPSSRSYTNQVKAGTNLTATVVLRAATTNRLYTLQPMTATNLTGPWVTLTQWPALRLTNPVGSRYYRMGVGLTNF